ncbi:hypothetical protein FY528_16265 [Hymenobacter lutimineralis]|uniref:Translocation/assembly module TamB n=1 Tax=Hymenobacter lutimineralis TaxID=2606448 RepID=A0A5D6UTM5_9BACT|nr:hypothetical protein [Hymenobacter lutimineralis]TYZ07061.1 hypothetical protein FY528_16265 [Hymenobacter lutimineralis]
MKQVVIGWLWAALLLVSVEAWAQQPAAPAAAPAAPRTQPGKLSTDPAQYIIDVQAMMASTKNPAAIASGVSLQTLWASNKLTASQQRLIVDISQRLLAKRFKPRPHFETFFNAILAGATKQNLSDQQMDGLLTTISTTLDREQVRDTEKFLNAVTLFLQTNRLYYSRYNRVQLVRGGFSFAYNQTDQSLEPAVAPEPTPTVSEPVRTGAAIKTTKPAAKPAKKKSTDGWDTVADWGTNDGWGSSSNDGWGAPAKKAPAKPAPKTAGAKPAAAPVKEPEPEPTPAAPTYFDDYMAPPTRGPVIVLKDVDLLVGSFGADSALITKTTGFAVPLTNRFVGYGGQYAWQVKGNPVTADLTHFDMDMGKPEFKAEPVTMTYAAVLESPVKGALSFKSLKKKPGSTDSSYPRFISLTNDARVKNIGDNIKYVGGFALNGQRAFSASLDGSLSTISVQANGVTKFRASARAYELGDTLLSSSRAAVSIYEDKVDSVYHPGVKLKFSKARQVLQLAREEGLYKTTPYYDSYHQMEITTELLTWPINTPLMNFSMLTAKNQVAATFESREFYTNTRYQQIKGINRMHPLQMVVGYSTAHENVKTFSIGDLVQEFKLSEPNVRSAMAGLARDGYVRLNPDGNTVSLLPKASHYVSSARGKKDYDHIAIKSVAPGGRNAVLNLDNKVLTVRGVDRFNFSDDSVAVFVQPDSSVVRILKNRNIEFNGTLVASAFVFKGKEFRFDYDGFYVDLVKIDSIIVKGKNSKGSVMKARKDVDWTLTNKSKNSAGKLYINHPKNKSGRKKIGSYPSFDATTGAYVFFDKPEVLGGAYDTTVYFDIPPFRIDSLNNKNRSAVGFKGKFVTGGIMPAFETKLSMQDDGSLGFVYQLPKEGFPLYGGKGKLFNTVKMSNRGIQGIGEIKYLAATLQSKQFIFYKDSVVTVGTTASLAEGPYQGAEYPKVDLLPGYQMKWAVRKDSMYWSTAKSGQDMRFYGGAFSYRGEAVLTPTGLYGNGRIEGPQSLVRSRNFTFLQHHYKGTGATLSIKSSEENKPAVKATDVAIDYDIKQGFADFSPEKAGVANVELPYTQYRTSLSGGKWDFKKKTIVFRVTPGADSTRSYFYSTKPDQHGLKFQASSGVYDLRKYQLMAGGVPRISSADAWIEPDSNKVYVAANADMRAFRNARVTMDTLQKYHQLYQGEVDIQSRLAFTGNALYSYKNAAADSFALKFANFRIDSSQALSGLTASTGKGIGARLLGRGGDGPKIGPSTLATVSIKAEDKFHLAPRIAYRGSAIMNSKKKRFAFDGQSKLEFVKNATASTWFAVQDSIDPKRIQLRVQDPKAEDGTPLFTGLFLSETNRVYPLFVGQKASVTDQNIFQVDGTLSFDAAKRTFRMGRQEENPDVYEGSVLTFNDSTTAMGFRGKVELITSNKDYTLEAAAIGKGKPDSSRYELDTFMALDINLPEKAIIAMAEDMGRYAKGLPEAMTGTREEYLKLGEFVGSKSVQQYQNRKGGYSPLQKLSPKLLRTIVLNRVKLVWSDKQRAWYSTGKIGLISIYKKDINAEIDGFIEIKKESTGDVVEMYLEAEPQTWYYIKYANNTVLTKAQHGSYDEIVGFKAKGDYNTATEYGFFLGDDQEVQSFLTRFRKTYLGLTGKDAAKKIVTTQPEPDPEATEETDKKKKKKKGTEFDVSTEPAADAPIDDAPVDRKKKKKKDDATEEPAATPTEAAPAEDTGKKKKKKDEPVVTEPTVDTPTAPAEDTSKKKKKKKESADDPFGEQ